MKIIIKNKSELPIYEHIEQQMKMKLMIAVALSHNAELMIPDEPTSGLDPVARDELLDILSEYIQDENRGVLFSTHITADVERIAVCMTCCMITVSTILYFEMYR